MATTTFQMSCHLICVAKALVKWLHMCRWHQEYSMAFHGRVKICQTSCLCRAWPMSLQMLSCRAIAQLHTPAKQLRAPARLLVAAQQRLTPSPSRKLHRVEAQLLEGPAGGEVGLALSAWTRQLWSRGRQRLSHDREPIARSALTCQLVMRRLAWHWRCQTSIHRSCAGGP